MPEQIGAKSGYIIVRESRSKETDAVARMIEINVIAIVDSMIAEAERTGKFLFLNWGIAIQAILQHINEQPGFADFSVTANAGLNFMTQVHHYYSTEQVLGVPKLDQHGQTVQDDLVKQWDQEPGVQIVGKKAIPGKDIFIPGVVIAALEERLQTNEGAVEQFLAWLEQHYPEAIQDYVKSLVGQNLANQRLQQ